MNHFPRAPGVTAVTAVTITVLAGAVLTGCTSTTAEATSSSASSTSASPGTRTFRAACEFDYRPGHLRSQGGSQMMVNGEVFVACGGGPTIALGGTDGDAATFARKGAGVRVAEGATEQVGPYRVHVTEVQGERVRFEMSRPD